MLCYQLKRLWENHYAFLSTELELKGLWEYQKITRTLRYIEGQKLCKKCKSKVRGCIYYCLKVNSKQWSKFIFKIPKFIENIWLRKWQLLFKLDKSDIFFHVLWQKKLLKLRVLNRAMCEGLPWKIWTHSAECYTCVSKNLSRACKNHVDRILGNFDPPPLCRQSY